MRTRLLVLAACSLSSGCFVARHQPPAFRFSVDAATDYVHRGMLRNTNGVLQAEMNVTLPTVDGGQVDANVWGNVDLRDETGAAWFPDGSGRRFSAIDLTGSWSRSFEQGDVTLGLRSANLPEGSDFPFGERAGTAELFATLGRDWGAYYPAVTVHYDFDQVDDAYVRGSVERKLAFDDPRITVLATVSLGLSGADHSQWTYGVREGGPTDLTGVLDLRYRHDEITTYRVFLAGATIVDDDVRDGIGALGIETDNVWAGVGVAWSL